MVDMILATKLYIPSARFDKVPRPSLLEQLDAGTSGKLNLISAPAGFGKTSLARDWVLGLNKPVAWLSLDEKDNDLSRFFSYLIAALQQIDPSIGREIQGALFSVGSLPIHDFVTALVNEIAVTPSEFVLVLDDYHLIREISIHETLRSLLEHQPPQMHMVITTREDPPFPLARLRAQHQMNEIRAKHLRFSKEETDTFLNDLIGLDLSNEEVLTLTARTEGWIAGLQLAALSLRDQADRMAFVRAFSGTDRHIMDYLMDEVLSVQSPQIQTFLLRTSVLERFNGPLCDALIDGNEGDSQSTLELLEQANLFLLPLDNQRSWYRYHQLFADLLRARLQQSEPELVPRLHLEAAGWYEQNGFILEAVQHAFTAGDHGRAADIIEEYGHRRWSLNDSEFLSLVGRLSIATLHLRPSLGIYHAWILFISGQYEATESLLRSLIEHIPPPDSSPEARGMRSFVNLLLIYIAEMSGKELADELPDRRALEFVPEHHLGMRNSADVLYAYLLDQRGDFNASEELLLNAVQRDIAANGYTAVPICISRIARNWILQGQLIEAASMCRKYIDYVQERGERRFFIAGNLYLVLSNVLREWNDLEGAEQMVQAGIQANEPWKLPQIDLLGYMAQARLLQARNDFDGALAVLEHLEPLIQGKSIAHDMTTDLHALKVKLWLVKGDREKAWGYAGLSHPFENLVFRHELDHILLARLYQSGGRQADALDLLEHLAPLAESGGRNGRLVEILLLQALALASLNRTPQAYQKLQACLTLAEPQGYMRLFLEEGDGVRKLLSEHLSSPTSANNEYARRILQAFVPTGTPLSHTNYELIDPLTRRELAVLKLICTGDSNQDIANKLVITISSVKKHTGNIYSKLGVGSRTQAIARAHQLNLISFEP